MCTWNVFCASHRLPVIMWLSSDRSPHQDCSLCSVLVFALKVPFPSLTFHCDTLGQNDSVIPHKPLPPAPIHASQFAERRRFWLCNLVHFHAHHASATAMQHRPHCCCCCSAVVLLARDHLAVLSRRVLSIDKEWCSESEPIILLAFTINHRANIPPPHHLSFTSSL